MRKANPDIKIGTCSVHYNEQDIVICPHRMLEHNQIFLDCLHLLTMHEPVNELYLLPEIQIPGGYVDYFLVSVKNKRVMDFVGIEIQTMDTTGTVWPARQKFLSEHGIRVDNEDLYTDKNFGMNWKMTMKTILMQMHHKSETFEHLNKHLVLIVQKPLFEHMLSDFDFAGMEGVRIGDPVHIHVYDFKMEESGMELSLHTRISTDVAGIARCLGLNADSKVELLEMISLLESKLADEYRFNMI